MNAVPLVHPTNSAIRALVMRGSANRSLARPDRAGSKNR